VKLVASGSLAVLAGVTVPDTDRGAVWPRRALKEKGAGLPEPSVRPVSLAFNLLRLVE